ncbi:GMC family oxidoreductase [Pseudanabaenaceae cyanobacterium LEGE 13415]|nr:GMC family oxidoreductase [Pseudanabaenaceae cyanobacterium LEGE 13415]
MSVKFRDLRVLDSGSEFAADLCIVGSGPAGLSIAKEFVGTGVKVLIVESGTKAEDLETQSLYQIENVGVPRELNHSANRYRIFGGTSHLWTGRCAPFDEVDFQARSWVPYSGWSITRRSLDPYLERAGENLGIGPHCYDERLWEQFKVAPPAESLNKAVVKPVFWQFSKHHNNQYEPARFGQGFMPENAPNIDVLMNANVTHLNTNAEGTKLESIEVTSLNGKQATIRAKAIVLCCGGIENARLLLASNRIVPQGVGNQNDVVGRFLMDHPGCVLGSFDPAAAKQVRDRFGHYWLDNSKGRHVYLHGMALSPELQQKEQLLNCAAYLETIAAEGDPWDAVKSLKEALKSGKITPEAYQGAMAVLTQPHTIGYGLYRRYIKRRPTITKADRVDLYCHVEQRPNPDSRLTLSGQRDRLGMPLSRIDWKISEQERQSVRRLAHLICEEFDRLNLPKPMLSEWLNQKEGWEPNFVDRAHPIGTTRMSDDPKQGVVDSNSQVHGVEGLFIAGSSVFPTAGHANPTLMIVAMSLRLADWLKFNYLPTERVVKLKQQVA